MAGRARTLQLRPFQLDRVTEGETVCAILKPASAVLRQARLYHAARSIPRNVPRPAQRVLLIRPRIRLIYYPVWRLRYRSRGRAFEAVIDGLRPQILRGFHPVVEGDSLAAWLTAAAAMGLMSAFSPSLATVGSVGWPLARMMRDGVQGRKGELTAWLRRQVGGKRVVARGFDT